MRKNGASKFLLIPVQFKEPGRGRVYSGFTIGVSGEITLNGAFLQEKPHLAEIR